MNIDHPSKAESGINAILARNIETLLEKRRREERRASTQHKVADAITRFAGSMPFVYIHAHSLDCGRLSIWGGWPYVHLIQALLYSQCWHRWRQFSFNIYSYLAKSHERNCRDKGRSRPAHQFIVGTRDYTSSSTRLVDRRTPQYGGSSAPDLVDLKQDVAPEKVLEKN